MTKRARNINKTLDDFPNKRQRIIPSKMTLAAMMSMYMDTVPLILDYLDVADTIALAGVNSQTYVTVKAAVKREIRCSHPISNKYETTVWHLHMLAERGFSHYLLRMDQLSVAGAVLSMKQGRYFLEAPPTYGKIRVAAVIAQKIARQNKRCYIVTEFSRAEHWISELKIIHPESFLPQVDITSKLVISCISKARCSSHNQVGAGFVASDVNKIILINMQQFHYIDNIAEYVIWDGWALASRVRAQIPWTFIIDRPGRSFPRNQLSRYTSIKRTYLHSIYTLPTVVCERLSVRLTNVNKTGTICCGNCRLGIGIILTYASLALRLKGQYDKYGNHIVIVTPRYSKCRSLDEAIIGMIAPGYSLIQGVIQANNDSGKHRSVFRAAVSMKSVRNFSDNNNPSVLLINDKMSKLGNARVSTICFMGCRMSPQSQGQFVQSLIGTTCPSERVHVVECKIA